MGSVWPEMSVSTSSIISPGLFSSVIWTLAPATGLEAIIEVTFARKYPILSDCYNHIEAGIIFTSFLRLLIHSIYYYSMHMYGNCEFAVIFFVYIML